MNTPRNTRRVYIIGSDDRKNFYSIESGWRKKPFNTDSLLEAKQYDTYDDALAAWRTLPRELRDLYNRFHPVILSAQIEPDQGKGEISINLNTYFPQMADLLVVFETARIALEKLDIRHQIATIGKISPGVLHSVYIQLSFMMAEVRRAYREVPEKLQPAPFPALESGSDEDA